MHANPENEFWDQDCDLEWVLPHARLSDKYDPKWEKKKKSARVFVSLLKP